MIIRKQKTNTDLLFEKKTSTFDLYRKKLYSLKSFEFQKQFMIDTFMIKLGQFDRTGPIDKLFILLVNLKI